MIYVGRRLFSEDNVGPWHLCLSVSREKKPRVKAKAGSDTVWAMEEVVVPICCDTVRSAPMDEFRSPLIVPFEGRRCKRCSGWLARIGHRWGGNAVIRVEVPMKVVIG